MTPQELRARAWQNIKSARLLLDSDPDHAAQTVGFAAELALKARYCTVNNWADFPDNRRELKKRGAPERLFSHDLDRLLEHSRAVSIKTTSMHQVNWARASDWSVDQRYSAIGTMSKEKAAAQIEETVKLFIELVNWEILAALQRVEISESKLRGRFTFFALVWDHKSKRWEVWIAAPGPPGQENLRAQQTIDAIRAALDEDLLYTLGPLRHLSTERHELSGFYQMIRVEHSAGVICSHNSVFGAAPMPPAYIITCNKR